MDSSTERLPQGYYHEDQPYDPIQYNDCTTTHQYSTPQGYVVPQEFSVPNDYVAPWQTEATEMAKVTSPRSPSKVYWFDKLNSGWIPEIVSEVFSVASLLAMIILLSKLDGQPLSTWAIAVSPNAVVAILSIASKASLIYVLGQTISQLKWLHLINKPDSLEDLQHFDDASRGPLGAIRMFWTVRPASLVAYSGCLAILLALAFEPFSQQLLHFDERVIADPNQPSSVSFSTAYDFGSQGVDGGSAVIVGPRDNLMTAATVNGVYDVVKDPPFSCPGSTCGYPTFATLGVCSECEDVTSTTKKTQLNTTFGQLWTIRTPSNMTLQASATMDAHSGFQHTRINATADILNSAFAGLGMPVVTGIVRFPEDQTTGRSNISNWMDTMQAYECKISFCGRRYVKWNTTNGTLSPGEEQIIKLNNSDVPAEGEPWYRVLAPLNPSDSLGTSDGNNSFRINYLDGENMANILTSVFTISNQVSQNQQIGSVALYSSPNIIDTMDNVAKGMSYRMMSGPNSTTIHGESYNTQTYIRVRWPWITLLATLTIASLFCLIAVIVMTRQARQRIWKSSLTPLLLTDISYPLATVSERPLRDPIQFRSRTRTIVSHLTR
ncbi:hypothetical protein F5Y19DRAFT_451963 [Xylariaceae sp. FL1651]|nr:hypothetical protein F5Y19DRAFT_451963 [Xylariaceae sp. FL1651]